MIDLPPDLALVVETPRLRLIPLTIDEAKDLYPLLKDERLYEYLGGSPPTEDALGEWIERSRTHRSVDGSAVFLTWVIRLVPAQEPVGYCQATVHDDASADMKFVIGTQYSGHGIAKEAVGGLVRALRGPLGAGELRTHIRPDHVAAQKVAIHAGMHRSGLREDSGEEVWFSPRPD